MINLLAQTQHQNRRLIVDTNDRQKPSTVDQRRQGTWPKVGQEMTPEAQLFLDQLTKIFKETGPYYDSDTSVQPTE